MVDGDYKGPNRRREPNGWFERYIEDTVNGLRREVEGIHADVSTISAEVTKLRIEFAGRRWSNAIFSAIGGALTVIAGGLLLWFSKGH